MTRVLNPAVLAVLAFLFLDGAPADGFRARALACVYGPGVPTMVAVLLRLRGRVDSVFMPDARQRLVPLVLAIASSTAGVWHLGQIDGPAYLRLLLLAYAAVALLAAGSTCWWPFSLHTAGVIVPIGAGVMTVSALYIATVPVALLIGWARLRCRGHTIGQVVVGFLVGLVSLIAAGGLNNL